MLKLLFQQIVNSIRKSSLARTKEQLIRTIIMTVIILAVIIVFIIIRSEVTPKTPSSITPPSTEGADPTNIIDAISTDDPTASEVIVVTPSPTPTPEPPAITPPAEFADPASGTDIIFESTPPTTDTDIDIN